MTNIDRDKGGPPESIRRALATVPEELWDELRALRPLIRRTFGSSPLDSPQRQAAPRYFELVKMIHEEYGVSLWSISRHLGLNGRTVKMWMRSHGYGTQSPSQKPYKGVQARREPVRVLGTECAHGHLLDEKNLVTYTLASGIVQNVCKKCRHNQYLAKKAKKKS